jgi:hypothetical protein
VLGGATVAAATVAGEYPWARLVRPMPWPVDALPYALLWGALTGAAVGAVAVWLHARLDEVGDGSGLVAARRGRHPHVFALAAVATLVAVIAYNAPPRDDLPAAGSGSAPSAAPGATLSFDEVTTAERRTAFVEARAHPRGLTQEAWWFEALSWQGGGRVKAEMTEVAPGVFRSERPVPLHGDWKTLLRLHLPVHTMVSVPIYLPADPAIPAPAVKAVDGADREFVAEQEILRREESKDVPAWLWGIGYTVTFALFGLVFALIGAAYALAARRRLPSGADPGPQEARREPAGAQA